MTELTASKNDWHDAFLKVLEDTLNVAIACRACNISRTTAYNHRNNNEAFKEKWDEALKFCIGRLEKSMIQRALEGEPYVYQGEIVPNVKRYDTTLQIFLLKNNIEKYRDKPETDSDKITAIALGVQNALATMRNTMPGQGREKPDENDISELTSDE